MYQVSTYCYGPDGSPALQGLPGHEWRTIARVRKLSLAIETANMQLIRTVVTKDGTAAVLHDNGKPHGVRRSGRLMQCDTCPCPYCQEADDAYDGSLDGIYDGYHDDPTPYESVQDICDREFYSHLPPDVAAREMEAEQAASEVRHEARMLGTR